MMSTTDGRFTRLSVISLVIGVCLFAASAAAQVPTGGIAGVVRDDTGGVLPGVTVEAASPALIEGVRTAFSDGEGRYNIVDLRPGTYDVTFTLLGFSTVIREGVELTTGFTATINADMQVGGIEETITVTGASPVVDVQNVRQQTVVAQQDLESLPVGQGSTSSFVNLVPGLTDAGRVDVGGSGGHWESGRATYGRYHGKHGLRTTMDGMRTQNTGSGQAPGYTINVHFVEEVAVSTGGITAEGSSTSMAMNHIVKAGGNAFSLLAAGRYMNSSMQGDNLDDELVSRGVTTAQTLENIHDIGVYVGGPLQRDKLWFYTGVRRWGLRRQIPGMFYNKTQGTNFYTPDLDRPVSSHELNQSYGGRLTYQASENNKVGFFMDWQDLYGSHGLSGRVTNAPESQTQARLRPSGIIQGTWTATPTNRLLIEAGGGWMIWHNHAELQPEVSLNDIPIQDQGLGLNYNAPTNFRGQDLKDPWVVDRYTQRASVAYVTGSHNFKVGLQVEEGVIKNGTRRSTGPNGGALRYRFRNGIPNRVTLYSYPYVETAKMWPDLGLYAQDQWVFDRLTLNLGLRFDYWNGHVPEQTLAATRFLPERHFDRVSNVPNFKDLSPRLGASYDLFGNGRTALKISMGRYADLTGVFYSQVTDPQRTSIRTTNRSWNDANGNFTPDCDLVNPVANGECGAFSNSNFGQINPNAIVFDDEVMQGWNARKATWDIATEVQQELTPGLSMTVGYYHNWDKNLRALQNVAVTPADFDPYCITTPVDPGLPGGGGQEVCGLYDVSPEKFGQSELAWKQSETLDPDGNGTTRVSDFFAVRMDGRLQSGIRFGGGIDTGRTVDDNCFIVDNPQKTVVFHITGSITDREVEQRFCREVQGSMANLQVKLNGSIPVPGGAMVSVTYVNVAGANILADYAVPNSAIEGSLGRPLSGGARTATIPLIEPYTQYEGRRTLLDVRLSKAFDLGAAGRLEANVDLYNLTNANTVINRVDTFGSRWGTPTVILPARMLQVGGRLTF